MQEQQDFGARGRGNDRRECLMARDGEEDNALKEIEECRAKIGTIFDDIQVKTKLAYGYLKEDYELIQSKRDKFMVMSQKIHEVHFHDVIKLNVGGHVFQTSLDNLRKYPQSVLATMFSESFELVKGEDGSYFIDRDGEHFRHILNYLRSGEGPTSAIPANSKEEIRREATFYGLTGLVAILNDAFLLEDDEINEDSSLETDDDKQSIDGHYDETTTILDEIKVKLEDGHANMLKSIASLERSKEKYLEMTKKIENIHISDIVKLDVGGCIFKSNVSTLQKDPESLLAQMFSGQIELTQQQDGSYFIDRDCSNFRHILNYLRNGDLPSDVIKKVGKELLVEARFYNMQGLINAIKRVKINMSDATFETTSDTLMNYPHSKLARALTEEVSGIRNIDGNLYIDRPGKCFGSLLEVMQDESVTRKLEDDIIDEAKHFDVKCIEKYTAGIFPGSKILQYKPGYQQQILQWLNDTNRRKFVDVSSISLAYSADQDGWKAAEFHAKCDDIGPNLVLFESCFGNIFGGFIGKSWDGFETCK